MSETSHTHSHAPHGLEFDVPAGVGLPHMRHSSYGKLMISFWVVFLFMGVEIACGWLFHSLTLMSDGFHMLSDAVSLGLSALAVHLAARQATEEKTFGFKRLEILAAFGNGLTLVLLSLFICFQSAFRLFHPMPVKAESMLWVACLGLLINLFVAWWLHQGEEEKSLNLESAFWHVIGDLGASAAAVIAALGILWKGWMWLDPVLALAIAASISLAGLRVLRRSGHILVEGTPEGVEIKAIRGAMLADRRVRDVHDLHMWTMNGRDLYLSAHVETVPGEKAEKEVMDSLTLALSRDFHVNHITLQVGRCAGDDCFNRDAH